VCVCVLFFPECIVVVKQCLECNKNSAAAGGLLFRCEMCPDAYCEDHLPIDAEIVGGCDRFEALGMRKPSQACFIHCTKDCQDFAEKVKRGEV
jgi:SWI/SNF-related matrix-associated actin-dependent regulator of chromatin subfamily A member 5